MIKNISVRNGIIFAVVIIGMGLVLYYVDKAIFLNPSLRMTMSIALPIFFARKSILDQRAANGGTLIFNDALRVSFLTRVIGITAFAIFQNILLLSDYNLLEIQRTLAVESAQTFMRLINMPESTIAEYDELTPDRLSPTFASFSLGLARNYFFGFFIALITTAILNKIK